MMAGTQQRAEKLQSSHRANAERHTCRSKSYSVDPNIASSGNDWTRIFLRIVCRRRSTVRMLKSSLLEMAWVWLAAEHALHHLLFFVRKSFQPFADRSLSDLLLPRCMAGSQCPSDGPEQRGLIVRLFKQGDRPAFHQRHSQRDPATPVTTIAQIGLSPSRGGAATPYRP